MWVCEEAPHGPCTLKAAGQVPLQTCMALTWVFLSFSFLGCICASVCVHVLCMCAFSHMRVHQYSPVEMCAHLCKSMPS